MIVVGISVVLAGFAGLSPTLEAAVSVVVRGEAAGRRHLNATFSDVRLHLAGEDGEGLWFSLPLAMTRVDLASLHDATEALSLHRAPPGNYTQIRIVVSSVEGVLADGPRLELTVPDAVLKTTTPFRLEPGGTTRVVPDLDLGRSVHSAGNEWIFVPVLGSVQAG